MAIAVARLAWELAELGHDVRAYAEEEPAQRFQHPRLQWLVRPGLFVPDDFAADLVISALAPVWRRTAAGAAGAGALERLVYWHHAGGIQPSYGGSLLAASGAEVPVDWQRVAWLRPSSWAIEEPTPGSGPAILVPGAGLPKGGHVARAVALGLPGLRWFVLRGRCALEDISAWASVEGARVAIELQVQASIWPRVCAVLAPTRAESYGLLLVEAAVRGLPVVCSDLPATRAALGGYATLLPPEAPPQAWSDALLEALAAGPRTPLRLRPYREEVAEALALLAAPLGVEAA